MPAAPPRRRCSGPGRTGALSPALAAARLALMGGVALLVLAGCAGVDPYAWSRGSESGQAPGQVPPGPAGRQPSPQSPSSAPLPAPQPPPAAGGVPEAVRPPASARERLRTVAIGDITYECRRHLIEPTRFVWSFVVPNATLYGPDKRPVGRYYAGPTWEGRDKSKVTGRQVGSAPVSGADLPLQLIKADVSTGTGIMKGVSYIQRLNTSGGLPSGPCNASLAGKRQQVPFQADYVFY